MSTPKVYIPKDKIEELYLIKNYTLDDTSKELGVSKKVIRRLLKEYEITKPKELQKEHYFKIRLDKAILYKYFIEDNLSVDKIADILKISSRTIRKLLKEYNIIKSKEQIQVSREKDLIEKYGSLENARNTINNKRKNTNIEKYGNEYLFNNQNIQQKGRDTKLKRYGISTYNNWQKTKETKLKNFGNENYNNREKYKQTVMKKYHCIHYSQSEEAKEKIKNTNLKQYGVSHYSQSIEYQNRLPEILKKHHFTRKLNGTCNTSHTFEDILINYLLKTYNTLNIKTHYSEDIRYPFECDVYIKDLDLFIEFNGGFFHNYKPFIESEENIKEYEYLCNKSKLYKNIANTWRYRDVKKRETAKKNNLNYFELWECDKNKKRKSITIWKQELDEIIAKYLIL